MKRTYQLIITLVLGAGLTACVTTEEDMDDIQPFAEGPWGSTYIAPPPPPNPVQAPPPQTEWVVEIEEERAPIPESEEKKFGWFGKRKSTETASEEATAVPVTVEEIDVEIEAAEATPEPTPVAAAPEVTATLVPEPKKEKRFAFFGRKKDPVAESAPALDREAEIEQRPGAPSPSVSFVDDIKPIFQEKCVTCHNRDTLHGRVSLESRQLAFQHGPASPLVVPGNPEGSVLLRNVVTSKTKENAMPPVGHRVTREEKDLLYAWIMEGAHWPDGPSGRITPDVIVRE